MTRENKDLDLTTNELTMSTLEIAELTGKRHDNVLRDTREMLSELSKSNLLKSEENERLETSYVDTRGREQPHIHLNRALTDTLLTGYSHALRYKVVLRWHELEQEQQAIYSQFHSHPRINKELAGYLHNLKLYTFAHVQSHLYEESIRQMYRDRDEVAQGSAMFVEALEQIKVSQDPLREVNELLEEHYEGERKMRQRIFDLEGRIKKNMEVMTTLAQETPMLVAMANQGPKLNLKKLAFDVWQAQRMGADSQHCYELSELIKP